LNLADLPNNIDLADFHASMLMQFRAINPPTNMIPLLKAQFAGEGQYDYLDGTAIFPRQFYGGTGLRKVMYVDGVTSTSQAQQLVDGYAGVSGDPVFASDNSYFVQCAARVLSRIQAPSLVKPEHLDLVGYSGGGATVMYVARALRQTDPQIKLKIITFGSPRPGLQGMRTTIDQLPIARWMTAEDPIPLVPPRVTDAPLLLPIIGVSLAIRWGQFVQPGGGIAIKVDGSTLPSVLPPYAAMNPINSLATWFAGQEGDSSNPHSLQAYRSRLILARQAALTPGELDKPESSPEKPDDTNKGHMTVRERQFLDLIANAGDRQNLTEPSAPEAKLFKAVRLGRLWVVTFGDKIICWAPIEARARHIARAGNDFMISLQKQALVDPDTLTDQVQAYLAAAVDPASDFSPKINVGL
jgi:hypothetical protein